MLRILVGLFVISFSLTSFSKNVELKIKLTHIKGEEKIVREAIVIAKLGKDWEIPFTDDKSFKMKMNVTDKFVVPKDIQKDNKRELSSDLLMTGSIYTKNSGKEKLFATPQIMFNNKTEAIFE